MDILLPDMNGTDLLKKVKEVPEHKDTPVIAVTGFATANDKERFTNLGFTSYIAKPVVTATFVDDVLKGFQEKN
jgi:CheY-like chemotaxis protein